MTWLKIDDGFHCHPKIEAVGNAAAGLFVRCLAYCAQHNTDGFVPDSIAKRYGTGTQIARVSAANLWRKVDGGYLVHDYLDYNPSAEKVRRIQEERAEAGRRGGIKSGETRRSKSEANASGLLEPRPVPSRPSGTSSQSVHLSTPVDNDDDDERFVSVVEAIADDRIARHPARGNQLSYRTSVVESVIAEQGEAIRAFLASFHPDADAEQAVRRIRAERRIS